MLFRVAITLPMFIAASGDLVVGQTQEAGIPAGGEFRVSMESAAGSETSRTGDRVQASLRSPVANDGRTVLPAGTVFEGRVESVQSRSQFGNGFIRVIFDRMKLPNQPPQGVLLIGSAKAQPRRLWVKALASGAIGSALGTIAVGRKQRVAGGLGGGIAGILIAVNTHRPESEIRLKPGDDLTLRLMENLQVAPGARVH